MVDESDSSATRALVQATIQAEEAKEKGTNLTGWQATMEDMIINPACKVSHRSKKDISRKGDSPSLFFNKSKNPVKTVPRPDAVSLDGATLSERIDSLKNIALVGKWNFPEMDDSIMRKWLSEKWSPLIGYTPIVSRLMKEWYSFHFLKVSDLEMILNNPWVSGRSFLALSRWYIGFDPLKNTPSNSLIWVKLPNLPQELWSEETLSRIGNSIGRFVYVDPWCRGEKDKRIAWILIERPFKGGYPDHLEIAWGSSKIHQRLDFWGIPFRCSWCHKTRHLIKNCSHRASKRIKKSKFNLDRKSESDHSLESLEVRGTSLQVEQKQGAHAIKKNQHIQNSISEPDPSCSLQDSLGWVDTYFSPPILAQIPEPCEDIPVPSPPPIMNERDIVVGSLPIQISSSSPTAVKSRTDVSKGKDPIRNDHYHVISIDGG